MENFLKVGTLTIRRETACFSLVLVAACFNMLLCWDLIGNNGQLFGWVFSASWGIGLLTTAIVAYILIQTTSRSLISSFSALLGTLLSLPLIILCFSYSYSSSGICELSSNPEQCLSYSVAVMTGSGSQPVGTVALYTGWQAILGLVVIAVLIAQLVSLTQEYRRVRMLV